MPAFHNPALALFAAKLTRKLLVDYGLRAVPADDLRIAQLFAEGWDLPSATFLLAQAKQTAKRT